MSGNLSSIFHPKSIAVIGASTNPEKMGYQILENIVKAEFEGPIYPVNPKATEILGLSVVNDVSSLPEGVDLGVFIIPAHLVPENLDRFGERGGKAAIVITGGFAEAGPEGEELQKKLLSVARERGIRVIGPNCQGVNYPYHNLCASWPLIRLRGDIAFVSQSGTVGAALIDWASQEKIGFSAFVSMGNRADVDESDLIDYFSDDPHTKVITLYIEGVKRPAEFVRALEKCTKPLVIYKAGRTERGRKAAESHTKSLAGRDEIFTALFKKYGVHRAGNLEELYDFSKALAYLPRPKGRRILIVTSSGGSAIIATDMAEEMGFSVEPLRDETAEKLREVLPSHCIVANPLDLTGDTDAERYAKVLEVAESDYDMVMTIFGDPIPGACEVVSPDKPHLVTYLGGAEVEREERERMGEKKIAVFPTPERAITAASLYLTVGEEEMEVKEESPVSGKLLSPIESLALMERYEIPVPDYLKASSPEEAALFAKRLGFPVVMKVNSPSIVHKSDAGGVIIGIDSEESAKTAFEKIEAACRERGHDTDGVLVMSQAAQGTEIIVGVTKDEQFGHALMLGLGGVFVEVLRDVTFRLLPVKEDDVRTMVRELKGRRVFEGARGRKPLDLDSLVALCLKVSRLVEENPGILEVDLNPVFLYE
ncbi:MAG: CoA-binding protein, partial [Deltaproteobacteria bacterium]